MGSDAIELTLAVALSRIRETPWGPGHLGVEEAGRQGLEWWTFTNSYRLFQYFNIPDGQMYQLNNSLDCT